ncbi:MAG TPA: helix-turn-helix transcriptional regulator [Verrucomicrobiaceae bacterium]
MLRKELVAASAEPLILSLLAQGESYGYAIIQEIKSRSKNRMAWTDGMLYPVLHRLERKGLIKSRWAEAENGRKRKYYSIKNDGKRALKKHHEHWSLVSSVLAGLRKEEYA